VVVKLDVEDRRQRHVVDVRVHADRVHDHVEGDHDRALDQRVLALDQQPLAVGRDLGDARLDVLDLVLFLAGPVVIVPS
jgi:hypothetical protein